MQREKHQIFVVWGGAQVWCGCTVCVFLCCCVVCVWYVILCGAGVLGVQCVGVGVVWYMWVVQVWSVYIVCVSEVWCSVCGVVWCVQYMCVLQCSVVCLSGVVQCDTGVSVYVSVWVWWGTMHVCVAVQC